MAIQLLKQEMFHNYIAYVHCKWRFRNKYRYLYLYKVISPPPSAKKKYHYNSFWKFEHHGYKHIVHNYNCMYNDLKIRHSSLYVTCIISCDTYLRLLRCTPPPLKMAFYLDVKYIHFMLAYIYSDVLNTST